MRTRMLSKEEWALVKSSYRFVPDDEVAGLPLEIRRDPWEKCWCEGGDSKYGAIMVLAGSRLWRWPDISEFYGDGNAPWD